MNLKDAILKEHSKAQANNIVNYILDHPEVFPHLMDLFFDGGYRITQRVSWPISIIAQRNPSLILPYLEKIILKFKEPVHDAVKRNGSKILLCVEIPEGLKGELLDIMFGILLDKKQPVAVKANAMSIIQRICKHEPDLMRELKLILEDQLPYTTAGFKSRAMKILKNS